MSRAAEASTERICGDHSGQRAGRAYRSHASPAAAGPGHYSAEPVLPSAGTWTLTVTVRLDEFTAATASTVFPVR